MSVKRRARVHCILNLNTEYWLDSMIDRIGEHLKFYQTALAVRQQRQEVLASNIANADTPDRKSVV